MDGVRYVVRQSPLCGVCRWATVSHMTRHRSAAGVTVFDGQIYALGGHDGLSIFDSVSIPSSIGQGGAGEVPERGG